MPDWVRDYVMVHELMHLKRMDHSPRFWAIVAKAYPRYQEARRWLREHARGEARHPSGEAATSPGDAMTYHLPF